MAQPYFAEFGAIHHEDAVGILFTVSPPELAEEVARCLNVADQEGLGGDFLSTIPSRAEAQDEGAAGEPVEYELIERLLDAQQDINLAANETMSQSLADASALIDEIEPILRRSLSAAEALAALKAEGK